LPPGDTAYNVSKAALKALAESLSHDLVKRGRVTAHLLIPGFSSTGNNRDATLQQWQNGMQGSSSNCRAPPSMRRKRRLRPRGAVGKNGRADVQCRARGWWRHLVRRECLAPERDRSRCSAPLRPGSEALQSLGVGKADKDSRLNLGADTQSLAASKLCMRR